MNVLNHILDFKVSGLWAALVNASTNFAGVTVHVRILADNCPVRAFVGAGLLGTKLGTGSLEPNGVLPARGLQRVPLIDRRIDVVTIHWNMAFQQPQLVAGSGPGEWSRWSVVSRSLRPNRQR